MNYAEESLKLHRQWHGKLETVPKMAVKDKEALSLAYTPGVAQPCLEIQADPAQSYELTAAGTPWRWSPTVRRSWAWGTSALRPGCR